MLRHLKGFHLIEVLVTLGIISITAVLSYPIYTDYLICARRIEAENTLAKLALAMEKFHIENNSYENANLASLNFQEIIAKKSYRLAISQATSASFILTATPLGKQRKDNVCATLSLDSTEKKGISGNGTIDECWA